MNCEHKETSLGNLGYCTECFPKFAQVTWSDIYKPFNTNFQNDRAEVRAEC